MSTFVVISGLPGSGKSTVAQGLASALGMPWLEKDAILESLFDSVGVGDATWREQLSRAADDVLFTVARSSGGAILDNWWHHETSPAQLHELPGRLIEVFCECPPEIAVRRFQTRDRHRGHLDSPMTEAEMDEWCMKVTDTYPGPLEIGEHFIRARTDTPLNLEAVIVELQILVAEES